MNAITSQTVQPFSTASNADPLLLRTSQAILSKILKGHIKRLF